MKLMLMPKSVSWWVWMVTAVLLAVGLAGYTLGFILAIALSVVQTAVFLVRERALAAFPVQIRVTYTALLLVCYLPYMRWLYWLPTVGTFALVLFGYCLTARFLSVLPWNRTEPLSLNLLRRTFLSPPVVGNVQHGLPADGCPGGVCSLEARVAEFNRR
jgi:hypothetical protein